MQAKNGKATASTTADNILDVAQELLQRRGYNAISFQDIAERVGIRKASIHHHFAGKAALVATLVKRYRRQWNEFLEQIDGSSKDAAEKLEMYLAPFHATARTDDCACLCGILGAEFASLTKEVRAEVREFFAENERWLGKLLADGRRQRVFEFAGNPASEGGVIFACLEGALVVSRASGDPRRFNATVAQLQSSLRGK